MDFLKEEKLLGEGKKKPVLSKWTLIFLIFNIIGIGALLWKISNAASCTNQSIPSYSSSPKQCDLTEDKSTLIFTQILFRHGERTPMMNAGPYPNDPYKNYSYEPYGPGALTSIGKQTLFNLGKYLKTYYCNLLKNYHRDAVYALSSPFPRCRISLLIVLAAMFPPEKSQYLAGDLNWQPIPYESNDISSDITFLSFINCDKFTYLYREETSKSIMNNDIKNFRELLDKLYKYTGAKFSSYRDLFNLSLHLKLQKEFGLELPSWTKEFMPTLEQFEILTYNISSRTDELKTLAGGFILAEIINSMKSKIHSPKMSNRKIHLYSGHDFQIANLLGVLGVRLKKVIPYASFISFELHQINREYAVKVLYHERSFDRPKPLILNGCYEELCRLDTFIEIYGKYMASPEMCILDKQFKLSNSSEYFLLAKD